MSHHDFREAIATYWINSVEYMKDLTSTEPRTIKRKSSSTSTTSSVTFDSSASQDTETKKLKTGQRHVTDAALCPTTGGLKCRLDRCMDHVPVCGATIARCRLHWWLGVETQS